MQKAVLYGELVAQVRSVMEDEPDMIANAANLSAVLFHALPEVNWVGFYLNRDGQLVVGPFQGKPACSRIRIGKGVCGKAAQQLQTIVVDNVHEFPGHIACDSASNSEIVVPMVKDGRLIGLLDVDSPSLGRFDAEDRAGLEQIVELFLASSDVPLN